MVKGGRTGIFRSSWLDKVTQELVLGFWASPWTAPRITIMDRRTGIGKSLIAFNTLEKGSPCRRRSRVGTGE